MKKKATKFKGQRKTISARLFPTKEQEDLLRELSIIRTDIWNFYVNSCHKAYEKDGKILTEFDMNKLATVDKNICPAAAAWSKLNSKAVQTIMSQIAGSYASFFQLRKNGDKNAMPPRPIANKRTYGPPPFRSITFVQSGWGFPKKKAGVISINKIPMKYKCGLANLKELDDGDNIRQICIKHENGKWLLDVVIGIPIEQVTTMEKEKTSSKALALDLGLKKLATGIDSDGNVVRIHNKAKRIGKCMLKHIAKVDAKISKTESGSRRNRHLKMVKAKLFTKRNAQVKQCLHIEANRLIDMGQENNYDVIAVGDLSVKELMQKDESKKRGIAKAFGLSNVSMFVSMLTYKGKRVGINVCKIDEAYTTQINCLTGQLFPEHVGLNDRTVRLSKTIELDRDLASVINIYERFCQEGDALLKEQGLAALTPPLAQLKLADVLRQNNLLAQKTEEFTFSSQTDVGNNHHAWPVENLPSLC